MSQAMTPEEAKAKAEELFTQLDINKNGTITREDFLKEGEGFFIKMRNKGAEAIFNKLLESLDTNKDSVITKDEFVAAFIKANEERAKAEAGSA